MNNAEHANDSRHYMLLVVAIVIGLVGVYFRFLGDSFLYSGISNLILIVGVIVAFKGVFAIMK